jgi:hypothetical protein
MFASTRVLRTALLVKSIAGVDRREFLGFAQDDRAARSLAVATV